MHNKRLCINQKSSLRQLYVWDNYMSFTRLSFSCRLQEKTCTISSPSGLHNVGLSLFLVDGELFFWGTVKLLKFNIFFVSISHPHLCSIFTAFVKFDSNKRFRGKHPNIPGSQNKCLLLTKGLLSYITKKVNSLVLAKIIIQKYN